MGLLRASLIFVIGNFSISLMQKKHLEKLNIKQIPIIGIFLEPLIGDALHNIIKTNQAMALLIIITFIEFIL
tara:strand:+ start:79 stop:294 length:216 start_codon:yes stop_codon:yes gene_type:complete